MPIKISKNQKEKEVGFLFDVNPEFVSLVRHGANQQPFRIVKNEEGGSNVKIIQSILVPAGTDIQKLVGMEGLEYLAEAKLDSVHKTDEYERYDQIKSEKVSDIQVLKVGEGWLLVGTINENEKSDDALVVSEEQYEKLAQLPTPEALADDPYFLEYGQTFMSSIDRELYAMAEVISGALKQANAKGTNRKKTIFAAIDSFKSYMAIAVDALGNEATKTDTLDKFLKGGDNMELFKDEAEFTAKVQGLIAAGNDNLMVKMQEMIDKKAEPVTEPAPEPIKKADEDPVVKDLKMQIATLTTGLSEMKEKFDAQLETLPSPDLDPEIPPGDAEELKKNPFGGLLTRQMQ